MNNGIEETSNTKPSINKVICMHPRKMKQVGIKFGGNVLIRSEICGQCGAVLKTDFN